MPPTKVSLPSIRRKKESSIPEICEAMCDWFTDIRCTLKARSLKSMFEAQCKIICEQWLSQQEQELPEEIVFSNRSIRGKLKEHNVHLIKPNKNLKMKQANLEERSYEYLKNIWTTIKFFIDNFAIDNKRISNDLPSRWECLQKSVEFHWLWYLC